jgi:hypothetical protein
MTTNDNWREENKNIERGVLVLNREYYSRGGV